MSIVINLADYEGRVYKGRTSGERIRAQFALDAVDNSDETVEVIIPDDTYTVTTSFFLGLLGPSVARAGSKEMFFRKFRLHAPEFLKPDIEGYVAHVLIARTNRFGPSRRSDAGSGVKS